MKVVECRGADRRIIAEAAECLASGEIIIYPTDTVYALGCDALNVRAVEKLCRIKNINPDKNLLSIVCADISQASEYSRIDNRAFTLLKRYLPGPFTFILPAATKLPRVFRGRKSVGIRIPDSDFARTLAESFGKPILTTSLNSDDEDADIHALADEYSGFKDIRLVVGGQTGIGVSTVVDLTDSYAPELVRQGIGEFCE